MNIGIVTTWFERGAAYVSRAFMDCLQKEHNVFIYARGGEKYAIGDPRWDTSNVCWAPRLFIPGESVNMSRSHFHRWIKKKQIELVIFNEQPVWAPVLWCNEWGVKTIGYVDYYREKSIPLFASYDMLICNTKRHFSAFKWYSGAEYVPWGCDCTVFKPREGATEHPKDDEPVKFFLSCGMDPERKGADLLIRAFSAIRSSAKLIIHTQVDIKKSCPDVSPLVDRLVAEGKLKIITQTVPAPGCFCMGDVYVYAYRLDGLGLTVAEALASGLPAIVTDVAPANEFITPDTGSVIPVALCHGREDGYYWPICEANVDALRDVLDKYACNPKMVRQQKIMARRLAEDKWDWNKNSHLLLKLVKECKYHRLKRDFIDSVLAYDNRGIRRYRNLIIWFYYIARLLHFIPPK